MSVAHNTEALFLTVIPPSTVDVQQYYDTSVDLTFFLLPFGLFTLLRCNIQQAAYILHFSLMKLHTDWNRNDNYRRH